MWVIERDSFPLETPQTEPNPSKVPVLISQVPHKRQHAVVAKALDRLILTSFQLD